VIGVEVSDQIPDHIEVDASLSSRSSGLLTQSTITVLLAHKDHVSVSWFSWRQHWSFSMISSHLTYGRRRRICGVMWLRSRRTIKRGSQPKNDLRTIGQELKQDWPIDLPFAAHRTAPV
jgi:hypothetical protein